MDKNGDFLIQYNELSIEDELISNRLFYGLTKNGSYFFSNKSSYVHEVNININEKILEESYFLNIFELQDSKNLFVSIKDDNKNQYLFSINSYDSMVELYDLNSDNNYYHVWNFNEFFNLEENDYLFAFEYELFELKGLSEYIIAFIPLNIVSEDILNISFIKRFQFISFDKEVYQELNSINYKKYLNTKILNIFLLENSNFLGILTIKEIEIETKIEDETDKTMEGGIKIFKAQSIYGGSFYTENNSIPIFQRRVQSQNEYDSTSYSKYKFNLNFYFRNLKSIINMGEVILYSEMMHKYYQDGSFFIKSLNLNVLDKQFVIFLYFIIDDNSYFVFDLFEINFLDYKNKKNIISPEISGNLKRNNIDFDIEESLNDFIKINDNKVVFLYISKSTINELIILLIYINQLSKEINSTSFSVNLDNYKPTRIKGFGYNDYLLFSSTGNIGNNYLSIFMIFGYGNGTDNIIDITMFLNKGINEEKENFLYFLYQNFTIENNIFGYIPLTKIILLSFPEEILLYLYNFKNQEEIQLENQGKKQYIGSKCFLAKFLGKNENCQDYDLIIRENKNLIKTFQYYYIDYQNILIEDNFPEVNQEEQNFQPYFGRINRLKFKLCHKYCEKCYELSASDKEQKCLSCLPEYQYDYLNYINRVEKNPNGCVPEGYYYDEDKNELSLCNSTNYFFFFNTENNKKICFKKEANNECPPSYPLYNEINHQCISNIDYFLFLNKSKGYSKNCSSESEIYLDEMIKFFQESIINKMSLISIDKGDDFIVSTEKMSYVLTTTKNQKMKMDDNVTTIDLGKCEIELKNVYNITMNDSLYIFKIDILIDNIQKTEYEVYYNFSSYNLTKLNLTVCKDIKIDILIPKDIQINEIDKYNKSSDFYNDLCYTFTTNKGTDISIKDRRKEYKSNNLSICEDGCDFSGYNIKSKKAICSCFTKINLPLISEIKVDKEKLYSNFKDIRNIGNFEMLSCINLFFNKNNIFKNLSNYIMIILFILSIFSVLIFLFFDYKKINEFIDSNEDKISNQNLSDNIMTTKIENKRNLNIVQNSDNSNNKIKIKKKNKIRKNNKIISENKNNYSFDVKTTKKLKIKSREYNDYELNELQYKDALKKDKRTFTQFYLSLLKTKHILIFSFFQLKDYNSQIIKIFIFFFTFYLNLIISAMFYSDSTMHKIYIDDGAFDFTYQLPQMIYSVIISSILLILLKYLGLYEQDLIEFKKGNKNKTKVLSYIKIKIIFFFILAYILLFSSWIYLGCFCVVYKNTQIHLIKDVLSSFSLSFITPFFVFLLPSVFRIVSLKNKNRKNSILFKISNFIQNI